jgi:hypothetical protein
MRAIAKIQRDIEDEMAAFSESVDELESTVSEVEQTMAASKLHDETSAIGHSESGGQIVAD